MPAKFQVQPSTARAELVTDAGCQPDPVGCHYSNSSDSSAGEGLDTNAAIKSSDGEISSCNDICDARLVLIVRCIARQSVREQFAAVFLHIEDTTNASDVSRSAGGPS